MNPFGGGPPDRKTPEELLALARKLEGRQFQSWMPQAARADAVQEASLAGWQACNRCYLAKCKQDRCGFVRVHMQGAMKDFWQSEDVLSAPERWQVTHGSAADCRIVSLESLEALAGDKFLPASEPYTEGEMVMLIEEERVKNFEATDPQKVQQIQQLWAQGMPTMEIAEQLGVSTTTVRKYRHLGENRTDHQADSVPSNGNGQTADAGGQNCQGTVTTDLQTVRTVASDSDKVPCRKNPTDLAAIEQLLADRWQRLSLIERLHFFLGRD